MSEKDYEGTMRKVYWALVESIHYEEDVVNAINAMQNAGILFRERGHDREDKAEAWDDGFTSGISYQAGNDEAMWNPYRIESQETP